MASLNQPKWRYPNTIPTKAREKVRDLLLIEEEIEDWEKKIRVKEEELMVLRSELKTMKEERAEIEEELAEHRIVDSKEQQGIDTETQTNSPIHKLPDELLLLIFKKYLSFSHNWIRTLLLVCRRWEHLTLRSPNLWARIELKASDDLFEAAQDAAEWNYVRACQERSNGLLLDVVLNLINFPNMLSYATDKMETVLGDILGGESLDFIMNVFDPNGGNEEIECLIYEEKLIQFFDNLCGRDREGMARWKTLNLSMSELTTAHSIWEQLFGDTPNLISLIIGPFPYAFFEPGVSVDPGDGFPNLKAVTHFEYHSLPSFRTLSLSPTSLRYLALRYEDTSDLDLTQLNTFVSLQELRLDYVVERTNRRRNNRWKQTSKICLPALESLTLESMASNLHELDWQCPSLKRLQVISYSLEERIPALSVQHLFWNQAHRAIQKRSQTKFRRVLDGLMQDLVTVHECTIPSLARQDFLGKLMDDRKKQGVLASLSILNVEYPDGRIERIMAEDTERAFKATPPFPLE